MASEPQNQQPSEQTSKPTLSLDWWAVITALVLIVLVLVGILPGVPW